MALVTFINAIMSGKLEGTVYARNKSGYYVKGWTKPNDPKSAAQTMNRAVFGVAAGQWHAMTDAQKAAWNSYGTNLFVTKGGATGSPVSGFSAFVAEMNAATIAWRQKRITTVSDPSGTTVTFDDFSGSLNAPAAAMGSAIQKTGGTPLPILLKDVVLLSATGQVNATFEFPVPSLVGVPVFKDSNTSIPVGIVLQMSIPQTQVANFVTGKNNQIIGVMAPPTLTNAAWTGTELEIEMSDADSPMASYKTWVVPDQVVEISAYLITTAGQQRLIGSKKIVVT